MSRFTIGTGLLAVLALAVLVAFSVADYTSTARAQTPVDVAIDLDTTGNDARLTGGANIQDCREISVGESVTIDVILPPPGVDALDGLGGYEFKILFDPSVVVFTAADQMQLLNQATGSFIFVVTPTAFPVTASPAEFAALDLGAPNEPEPAGTREVGPGVLTRITVEGVAPGTTVLSLQDVILVHAPGEQIPNGTISSATISVDEPCVGGTPEPDVRIVGLDCNSNPEVVEVKNFGTAPQDLTNWVLRSDPVTAEVFNLDVIEIPSFEPGILGPDRDFTVEAGSRARATDPTQRRWQWSTTSIFRTGDVSDFVQIVDLSTGFPNIIDQVHCTEVLATPTPTPTTGTTPTPTTGTTPTADASPTPTPLGAVQPPAGSLPPTGDSIPVQGDSGSMLRWVFVGLGSAIAAMASAYVIYGRMRGRFSL